MEIAVPDLLLSPEIIYWIGVGVLAFFVGILLLILVGSVLVWLFLKKHTIFLPRITLMIVSMLEVPIKFLLGALGINLEMNKQNAIDLMLASIRNRIYRKAFSEVPFNKRAIFLPQCLRHPDCPAKLSPKGIQCVACGLCGIGELKKEAEKLGYMVFIVPGGSFVKRLIMEYKPGAIMGVGCHPEVKEGTAMAAAIGLPVQAVPLLKDGCVGTEADWEQVKECLHLASF